MLRWFGDLCAAVQGCDATGEAITTKAWLIKSLYVPQGLFNVKGLQTLFILAG